MTYVIAYLQFQFYFCKNIAQATLKSISGLIYEQFYDQNVNRLPSHSSFQRLIYCLSNFRFTIFVSNRSNCWC
jgi:hypothetical protein